MVQTAASLRGGRVAKLAPKARPRDVIKVPGSRIAATVPGAIQRVDVRLSNLVRMPCAGGSRQSQMAKLPNGQMVKSEEGTAVPVAQAVRAAAAVARRTRIVAVRDPYDRAHDCRDPRGHGLIAAAVPGHPRACAANGRTKIVAMLPSSLAASRMYPASVLDGGGRTCDEVFDATEEREQRLVYEGLLDGSGRMTPRHELAEMFAAITSVRGRGYARQVFGRKPATEKMDLGDGRVVEIEAEIVVRRKK